MGAEAIRIVSQYRKARDEGDYVAQAGILTSLLRMVMDETDPQTLQIARDTASHILRLQAVTA